MDTHTPASSAATTTPTTTPPPPSTIEATPPTVIRQKVRARLGGSQQQQRQPDSAIQTRSRGPHDEYVRFSAVNQQTQNSNSASARQSQTRQKTRTRTHSSASTTSQRNLPIESEGPGLVRIHSAKNQSRTPPVRDNDDNADEQEHEDRFDEPKPTRAQNAYTSTESSSISHQSKIRQRSQQNSRRPTLARIRTNAAAYVEEEDIATSVTKLPRSRGRTQNAPLSSSMEQEHKPSKSTRARNRRPAVRQRPVTAGVNRAFSEISPESSNELDENYPRASARPETQQHSLENENYPQEFLLNYGASQSYDDGSTGPVSSGPPTKSDKTNSADIHGAESQWSTKLSGNSFQPSNYAPNRADGESDKIFQPLAGDKAGDFSEIITAGPEQSSVTMLVSSDDSGAATDLPGPSSEESLVGSMIGSLVDFGKKMNGEAQPDSALDTVETAENPRDKGPSSTQAALEDFNNKATGSTFKKARLRHRRVRIRVKPASSSSEDFVTAESQGYESSLNKLPQEPIKFRNFYRTTQVTTSTTSETTPAALISTASPATERSESLFDDLLGIENEAATTIPTTPKTTTITTTTVSEMVTTIIPTTTMTTRSTTKAEEDTWTSPLTSSTSSSIEFPATTLEIGGEHTTLIEHQSTENLTSPTTITTKESSGTGSAERIAAVTTTTAWQPLASNSGESIIQSLNSDNSLRYFEAKSPAYNEYLRSQEQSKSSELSDAGGLDPKQPKNHRSKWSEVRQLSDKWSNGGAPAGPTNQSEAGVTDYVKAVFESIKNAGEGDNALPQTIQQPAELVKTSVSSSSRVVSRPASSQLLFGQRRANGGMSSSASEVTTTTATQTQTPSPTMTELVTFGPFVPSIMSDRQQQLPKKTSLEMNLGKILRTSTTTKVSHMTEICYRGRCVMSKPKKEGLSR
ncbi:hypothetical protein QAD02_014223 [Eretmocerus hayati]|uniref:Uncharacterized protein n=1 Tax=Eretmocerus hayati TaxID=131215 RepID=A0ACC2P5Z9_9HYME|nr:hypothetical protein QAD02_014223 [Eretmocerus hayati]